MHESERYMKIKTGVGANNKLYSFHYIVVRNAIEMKEVQQFTIESNGPHGQPH